MAVWLSGNGIARINEVILHRARLVLRWVTIDYSQVYRLIVLPGLLSILSIVTVLWVCDGFMDTAMEENSKFPTTVLLTANKTAQCQSKMPGL